MQQIVTAAQRTAIQRLRERVERKASWHSTSARTYDNVPNSSLAAMHGLAASELEWFYEQLCDIEFIEAPKPHYRREADFKKYLDANAALVSRICIETVKHLEHYRERSVCPPDDKAVRRFWEKLCKDVSKFLGAEVCEPK